MHRATALPAAVEPRLNPSPPLQRIRFITSAVFDTTISCEFITPFFPQVRIACRVCLLMDWSSRGLQLLAGTAQTCLPAPPSRVPSHTPTHARPLIPHTPRVPQHTPHTLGRPHPCAPSHILDPLPPSFHPPDSLTCPFPSTHPLPSPCALVPLCPCAQHFLLLASIANVGKATALAAFVATAPAFQQALCTGGNLADVTAKGQVRGRQPCHPCHKARHKRGMCVESNAVGTAALEQALQCIR